MTDETITLLLMRHAEAGSYGGGDHARELTPAGCRDAQAAGSWLTGHVGPLDLVVVSSATRTRQTWDQAVAGGAQAARVEVRDEIYDASPGDLLEVVTELPDDARTVLVLGHAPGIPMLAGLLASRDSDPTARDAVARGFAPATVCRLVGSREWADVGHESLDVVEVTVPRG